MSADQRPSTPLLAVDWSEVAVLVGPLVPDRDSTLLEPPDVGVTTKEPEQLPEHRTRVNSLGCHERESVVQIESHLVTEDTARASTRPITLLGTFVENSLHQV